MGLQLYAISLVDALGGVPATAASHIHWLIVNPLIPRCLPYGYELTEALRTRPGYFCAFRLGGLSKSAGSTSSVAAIFAMTSSPTEACPPSIRAM